MSIFSRVKKIIKSNINSFIDNHKKIEEKRSNYKTFHNNQGFDNKEAEYYANLEIPYGSSFEEIKKSYRSLLKKYHPDLYAQNIKNQEYAEEITRKLNESFNYFEIKFNKET